MKYDNKNFDDVSFPIELALSKKLTSSSKSLLLYLISTPISEPTYKDIRTTIGMSKGSISDALKCLVSNGVLAISQDRLYDSRNTYIMLGSDKWFCCVE